MDSKKLQIGPFLWQNKISSKMRFWKKHKVSCDSGKQCMVVRTEVLVCVDAMENEYKSINP